jgi:hypothetical protein
MFHHGETPRLALVDDCLGFVSDGVRYGEYTREENEGGNVSFGYFEE